MNIKKIVIAGAGALVMLSVAGGVFAELIITAPTMPVPVVKTDQKMVLEIGPGGRTLLRGTVTMVGTNSLTVKSWGGDWVVNTSSATKLAPGTDVSQFKVGDFVGVQGQVSTSATWTIEANLVRNWTERKEMKEDRKENEREIKDIMKAASPRNWEGVASNVNAETKTLTLTIDGVAYNVTLVAGAKVVNEKFMTIDFSSVKNDDKIRVYGAVTNGTITASVLRDVSMKPGYNVKENVK